jgi:hypothetical protein
MIDHATGWFKMAPIKNKTAAHIANIAELTWFTHYPLPTKITFDRGTEFMAEFAKLCRKDDGLSRPLICCYCASPFSWTTFKNHYILLSLNLSFLRNSSFWILGHLLNLNQNLIWSSSFCCSSCCPGYHNTHPNRTSNLACYCIARRGLSPSSSHLDSNPRFLLPAYEAPSDFYLVSVLVC